MGTAPDAAPDAVLVREPIGFASGPPREQDVGAVTGAACGEKDPARRLQRNGYRDRDRGTRPAMGDPRIPRLRKGRRRPGFPEPRRMAAKAPAAVIREACVQGIPTRPVNSLVRTVGMSGICGSQVGRLCKEIRPRCQGSQRSWTRPSTMCGPVVSSACPEPNGFVQPVQGASAI